MDFLAHGCDTVHTSDDERVERRSAQCSAELATDMADGPAEQSIASEAWTHLVALDITRAEDARHDPVAARARGDREQTGEIFDSGWPAWLRICAQLTSRIERLSAHSAALELGLCTATEASEVLRTLFLCLEREGIEARAGVGPTRALAHLALLALPLFRDNRRIYAIAPSSASTFLRRFPVCLLARLAHADPRSAIPPNDLQRLARYGIRTLGQVARLDATSLRRQFGGSLGTRLALLAHGADARPLTVTAPPDERPYARRYHPAFAPARVLAELPQLAEWMAEPLRVERRLARQLRLRVRWASGGEHTTRYTLPVPTNQPRIIAQHIAHLLSAWPEFGAEGRSQVSRPGARWGATEEALKTTDETAEGVADRNAVDELRITLSGLLPDTPEQEAWWAAPRQEKSRNAALAACVERLAQRHGRPMLLRASLRADAAIFTEDRFRMAPALAPSSSRDRDRDRGQDLAPAPRHAAQGTRDLAHVQDERDERDGQSARLDSNDSWEDVALRLHWW